MKFSLTCRSSGAAAKARQPLNFTLGRIPFISGYGKKWSLLSSLRRPTIQGNQWPLCDSNIPRRLIKRRKVG
jgi:hypothetical protein